MSRKGRGSLPVWEVTLERAVLALGRTPWGASGEGKAHGLLRVFPPVQRRLENGHDIRLLRPDGYVRYEVDAFSAAPLQLASGEWLQPGDLLIVIHLDNGVLSRVRQELRSRRAFTWWMWRTAERDFSRLAELIREGAIPTGAKAVWGESLLYTALGRMGFHTRDSPPILRTPFARLYSLSLMAVYGSLDLTVDRVSDHRLGEAWLQVHEFLNRFGASVGS